MRSASAERRSAMSKPARIRAINSTATPCPLGGHCRSDARDNRADRCDVLRPGACKIFKLHQPAECPQRRHDLFGDFALVERGASLARDPAQRRAERRMD